MAQDITADALNQIMNAKRAGKTEVEIKRISKLLVRLLGIMKQNEYIEFEVDNENPKKPKAKIKLKKLNYCKAVKPRFDVQTKDIEKYLRRFLISRNFGILVVSTSKGLMNQHDAISNNLGGSLIAYFY